MSKLSALYWTYRLWIICLSQHFCKWLGYFFDVISRKNVPFAGPENKYLRFNPKLGGIFNKTFGSFGFNLSVSKRERFLFAKLRF